MYNKDGQKNLTNNQKKAIQLIVSRDLTGQTFEDISRELDISSATLYNWRRSNIFRDELNKQADEVVSSFASGVYTRLGQIVNSKNSHDRDAIKAGEVILKLANKYDTTIELSPTEDMTALLNRIKDL